MIAISQSYTFFCPLLRQTRALREARALQAWRSRGFRSPVEAGEVVLERITPNGNRLVLQRARVGNVVAEASIFAAHYHCDAVVSEVAKVRYADIAVIRRAISIDAQEMALLQLISPARRNPRASRQKSSRYAGSRIELRHGSISMVGVLPGKGHWRMLAAELGVSPAFYRELAAPASGSV